MSTNILPLRQERNMLRKLLSATGLFSDKDDLSRLSSLPEFTEEEVRDHSSPSDCWIIINQLVYDVTDFLHRHPGGTEILWEHLGYDATLVFIGSGHSRAAYKMLDKFLIGRLRETPSDELCP